MDLLSDADPFCREGSKAAIIVLFSKAPPGAKADLKKELERKGVRKVLADSILKDVLGSSSAGSPPATTTTLEHLSLADERQPPSLPTTRPGTSMAAADDNISPVYIASKFDLDRTFSTMLPHFVGKETEHNWQARENGIIKVRGMLRAGVYEEFGPVFSTAIKSLQEGILKGVSSLRTTLATQGIALISELATRLGDDLESCVDAFVPPLLKMAGFTKRIVATSSQNAVKHIFQNVSYRHKFMELLWSFMADKTVATRVAMAEHLNTLLATHASHRKHALEHHEGLSVIEKILKKGLTDQHPEVRAKSREAFFTYQTYWPSKSATMVESFDSTVRKQLTAGPKAGGGIATAAASPMKASLRSTAEPPARKPGGPSSAILAAKRAASARMAKERRDGSGDTSEDGIIPNLPATPRTPASSAATPRHRPISMSRPRPVSTAVASPTSAPLPPSPPGESAGSSAALDSSVGSLSPEQARSRAASLTSTQSSSEVSKGSNGARSPTTRLAAPSDRSRNLSGSSAATTSSARSLKARSVADFGQPRNGDAQPFRPSARSRFTAPPNPDDTVQLDPSSSEADATLDLMGNASAFRAEYADDSVMFSDATHARSYNDVSIDAGNEDADETVAVAQAASDIHSASTPQQEQANILKGGNGFIIGSSQNGQSDREFSYKAPGLAFQTPRAPRHPSQAGAGWFKDRAERLDNGPISPFKSSPDALDWIREIRSGRAEVKVFRQVAKLCSQFKIVAGDLTASSHTEAPRLEPGRPSADTLGLPGRHAGRHRMHMEDDGLEGIGDEQLSQQTEAWRDGQLFDQLWESLKIFLLKNNASPSNDQITAALILLHKLIEYQHPLFVSFGVEEDVLEVILRVRMDKAQLPFVASSCEAIMDAWAGKTNPALGLDNLASTTAQIANAKARDSGCDVKVQALGLRGVSKILARLPAEVVEEELSKDGIKSWITGCFSDIKNAELRRAAAEVLVCANIQLQNPEVVFELAGPLKQDQKDLLTVSTEIGCLLALRPSLTSTVFACGPQYFFSQ